MRARFIAAFVLVGCSGSTLSQSLLDAGPDSGITLSGQVFDVEADAGIAGAHVWVGTSQVETGADGVFSAPAAALGLQSVQVTADGYWDGLFMVQLVSGDNPVLLQMSRNCSKSRCPAGFYCGVIVTCERGTGPAAVVGQITDGCTGAPRIAYVEVIDDYGPTGVCTGSDGRYRISGRLGGEGVNVKVTAPGFDAWELPLTLGNGDNDFSHGLGRSCSGAAPAQQCR